jgi:acetyltransferase-like isoleucine patch superfamily enzyme
MNRVFFILENPFRIFTLLLIRLPFFKFVRGTYGYQCQISVGHWFKHKVLNRGGNRKCYWPVSGTSTIVNPHNVYAGIDTCPGIMQGCYIQAIGRIYIGDYTQLGPNVTIISANHDLYDTRIHDNEEVQIGRYCWLGAGVTILPGVILGDFTIVGAGAVVTKSFVDGHCIIAGNPAKIIRPLDSSKCSRYEYNSKYNGYIESSRFENFRSKNLNV